MKPVQAPVKGCPGCYAAVRTQHLLCRVCWHLVPTVEQRAVQDAWHRYKRSGGLGRPLIAKRWVEYEQARNVAIVAVVAALEAAAAVNEEVTMEEA